MYMNMSYDVIMMNQGPLKPEPYSVCQGAASRCPPAAALCSAVLPEESGAWRSTPAPLVVVVEPPANRANPPQNNVKSSSRTAVTSNI